MVVDQFKDRRHRLLSEIAEDRPDLVPMYKSASADDDAGIRPGAFADRSSRMFPLHTEEHAILSKLYAEKQAQYISEDVVGNIDKMLSLYGHDPETFTFPTQTKSASAEESSQYLLPQYKRLCIRGKSDVRPATEALLAQKNRLKVATVTEASVRAVTRAADYGLDERDLPADIYKYAGLTSCDAGDLLDWIEARAVACTSGEDRATYQKIAQAVSNNFPPTGVISSRDSLVKIANAIEAADESAGLTPLYGHTILDPIQTVFNMDKVATLDVDMGGQQIPLQQLLAVPPEVYEEILGEGVMEAAVGPDGQVDPQQFQALLQTLPADLKTLLASTLAPYLA